MRLSALPAVAAALLFACSTAPEKGPESFTDAAIPPFGDASPVATGDAGTETGTDAASPPQDQGSPPLDGLAPDRTLPSDAGSAEDAAPPDDADTDAPRADARPAADATGAPPDTGSAVPDAAVPLPACAPAADPRPGQPRREDGRFVRFPDFDSAHVAPRRVTVFLPPGGLRPDERLPVLYLHDGQNVFFDEEAAFGVSWGAIATADAAPQRLLLVAVDNTADRIDDYTPLPDPGRMAGGRAEAYGRFLVEELKPFVDFHFPTRCAAEETGLLGSSLGGLVSLYLGTTHPEVFGRVAAFSPSLWWAERAALAWTGDLAAAMELDEGRRLYLDTGNFEGEAVEGLGGAGRSSVIADGWDFMAGVAAAAPDSTDRLMLVEDPGGAHDEAAWRRRLPAALAFLYGPPLGVPQEASLWIWAPALRPGASTAASIFARDALGRSFTRLGEGAAFAAIDAAVAEVPRLPYLSAVAPGATAVEAAPAAPAPFTVASADESIVHLLATVPAGTDRVFAAGSALALGPWDPAAFELRRLTATLFEGTFVAPAGEPFEYKLTRGDWDTVEKGANGADIANRRHVPAEDGDLEVTVARWGGP